MSVQLRYNASNTASRFHQCHDFVRLLMGPVGSGKSVACCMEIIHRAMQQQKAEDGWRYSRWVVIRNTYPELKSTTVQTWDACINGRAFGNHHGDWFNSIIFGSPITHHIKFDDVDLQVWFLSMDKPKDVKKLLSLETTGVWINEARELPKAILDAATQRCGRYPPKMQGGASWFGVIMDTNPPDQDHWIYKQFEEQNISGFSIYKYPPAIIEVNGHYQLNPLAENTSNLNAQYYLNQAKGKTKEWIKVYLQGEYGSVSDGKPVYPEYVDRVHCVKDLKALPNIPLLLCWDFGLTPACVILQLTPHGQIRVLDELNAEKTGIKTFAEHGVKPFLATHYAGFECETGQADPAGLAGSQTDESMTCIGVLNELGFITNAAWTNDFSRRRNAVAHFLTQLVDGEPGLVISDRCQRLRQGFLGRYCFERIQVIGDERYKDQPTKNQFSHAQDALQYGCLKFAHHLRSQPKNITTHYKTGSFFAL
ncbi:MAG: hypothetical protein A3F10_05620 [Coxiella sp. RIFCSPHIGHO2_12_FULL_42_15]|nr:MAG: hypothetical protein A3F10_05620 [Coxiella sp. RIFCSPHIGHO2_12_FULL_42_15]